MVIWLMINYWTVVDKVNTVVALLFNSDLL